MTDQPGPCETFCPVVDECAARGDEISRLRAELDVQRRLVGARQEALQGALGQLERMTRERDKWRAACLALGEKARQAELERADAAASRVVANASGPIARRQLP